MSKYDIYELMGEYTDEEFAPQQDNNAHIKEVRKRVSERVKMPHRHLKLKTGLAAAAVAAAVCVGTAAFASPNGEVTMFVDMLTYDGAKIVLGYDESGNCRQRELYLDQEENKRPPLEVRDDRLWFVADGQDFDITDMIDLETAYIYKTVNSDTGLADWLVVGGIPEYYGFYEIVKYSDVKKGSSEDCQCGTEFCFHTVGTIDNSDHMWLGVYTIDGVDIPDYMMTEEELEQAWAKAEKGEAVYRVKSAPWMRKARAELGITWQDMFEDEEGIGFSTDWGE